MKEIKEKRIEKTVEKDEKNAMVVKTPLGEIIATQSIDSNFPGIYIDFKPIGSDYARAVALVEYTEDVETIRALLWGDKGNIDDSIGYTTSANVYDIEDVRNNKDRK